MANVKISTTSTTQGYQQPVNPNADGVVANGFYPQNGSSNDADAGIERATDGELKLKAGGTATLAVHPPTTASPALVRISNSSTTASSVQLDAPTSDVSSLLVYGTDNSGTGASNPAVTVLGYPATSGHAASITSYGIGGALRLYAEDAEPTLLVTAASTGAAISTVGAVTVAASTSSDAMRVTQTGSGNALVVEDSANPDSTPFVITATGNVGVGVTPATGIKLHVASDTNTWIRAQSAAGIPLLNCNRSNGTTAAPTAVVANDELGRFDIRGYANADFRQAAQISVSCASTPGGSDTAIASSMSFLTSPGGTTAPAARLYINQIGNVQVNAPGSGNALIVKGNLEFNDGTVQATSAGTISRLASAVTTTSTAFTDVTGLTASLGAGTPYFFDAYLIWQQNNTSGGIGFAINGPANMGVLDYTIQYQNFANDAAGTIQTVHSGTYDSAYTIPTTTTAANTSYIARISGVLVTTITAGTLALRFKSNNASYTASIRPGSWLLLRRGNT